MVGLIVKGIKSDKAIALAFFFVVAINLKFIHISCLQK